MEREVGTLDLTIFVEDKLLGRGKYEYYGPPSFPLCRAYFCAGCARIYARVLFGTQKTWIVLDGICSRCSPPAQAYRAKWLIPGSILTHWEGDEEFFNSLPREVLSSEFTHHLNHALKSQPKQEF